MDGPEDYPQPTKHPCPWVLYPLSHFGLCSFPPSSIGFNKALSSGPSCPSLMSVTNLYCFSIIYPIIAGCPESGY